MLVTVQHLHSVPSLNGRVGFCARGARAWFARQGLDWAEFVRGGIDAEVLLATGDPLARRVVEHAQAAMVQAETGGV